MNELALKYGCNPNQKPSRIYMEDGSDLPADAAGQDRVYIRFMPDWTSELVGSESNLDGTT